MKNLEFYEELEVILDKYTENGWMNDALDGDDVDRLTEHVRNQLNLMNGNITNDEYLTLEVNGENKSTYAIYVEVDGRKREEYHYEANNIHEALGKFFKDNPCISYDDIIDHVEL